RRDAGAARADLPGGPGRLLAGGAGPPAAADPGGRPGPRAGAGGLRGPPLARRHDRAPRGGRGPGPAAGRGPWVPPPPGRGAGPAEWAYRRAARGKFRLLTRLPGNEVFQLDLAERTLLLPRLPAEWDGLTVLHLTDLHLCGTPDLCYFEYVLERCARWGADLV